MTYEKIRFFLEICEIGSINKAAHKMYISQQSLSRCISTMEDELKYPLFIRSSKGVELTTFGKMFQDKAKDVTAAMEKLQAACDEFNESRNSTIIIGQPPDNNRSSMSAALDASLTFYRETYNTKVERVFAKGDVNKTFTQMLRSSEIDVAYMFGPVDETLIRKFPILDFKLMLLVCKDNPISARQSIRVEELADEFFVMPYYESGIYRLIEKFCVGAGFTPKAVCQTPYSKKLVNMVSKNKGVSLLNSESVNEAAELYDNLAAVTIEPECVLDYYLAVDRDRAIDQKLQNFIDFVVSHTRSEYRYIGI